MENNCKLSINERMIQGENLKRDSKSASIQQSCHVEVSFYASPCTAARGFSTCESCLFDERECFDGALITWSKSLCYPSHRLCLLFTSSLESWMWADLIWSSGLNLRIKDDKIIHVFKWFRLQFTWNMANIQESLTSLLWNEMPFQ